MMQENARTEASWSLLEIRLLVSLQVDNNCSLLRLANEIINFIRLISFRLILRSLRVDKLLRTIEKM